ncbi:tRNA pseudouridine(55) synthase TruB [Fulvivirga sp. RKSG066]|uniref:tRNA pseudouridine(55) synthase TruB n=1 Tax=Fulvivirga aurantia TaxID=2529383 RepID=UPI0012BD7936|nr:tRNA pseudouridine(55) synthase TruB [Fulvivirga aurantia]MTI22071.1 tRNA pseudouridine(55) synthase TruB [Fulvivirga aurantia]
MQQQNQEGSVLLVDKPLTWTSFDVVKKLRYHLKVKKIGHAGTLDPLATGLLILCTGKMTKQIEKFQAQEKEYTGQFVLGQTTPSYDLETEPTEPVDISHITESDIKSKTTQFTGVIEQTPPVFSAIKVKGKRAYESARKGEDIKLKSRQVEISEFDITAIDNNAVSFRVVCSKGTYIRSLAHDFGQALGVGAYLSKLRRTRIGDFKVDNAQTIEEITQKEE